MDNCIFCKIVKGEISAAKVAEDENFLAFLSIEPHNPGHTLVIPKKHVSYIFDMEDKDLRDILIFCKPVANAIKKAFNPKSGKVGIMVVGLDVPHAHIHLIPIDEVGDLNNDHAKHNISEEELQENAEKIKKEQLLASNPII